MDCGKLRIPNSRVLLGMFLLGYFGGFILRGKGECCGKNGFYTGKESGMFSVPTEFVGLKNNANIGRIERLILV